MRVKLSKSKIFYTVIGTVPIISSFGYFGQRFWNKYNVSNKSHNLDQNNDYIDLDKYTFDYSVNEDSDDAISSGQKSQSSNTHLKLLAIIQSKRDPMITDLAISAVSNTRFDDYQCRQFAQSSDFQTALRLARIPGIDSKLFLPPINTDFIKLNDFSKPFFDFNNVLLNLMKKALKSGDQCSDCTKYFTQLSVEKLETGSHSRQITPSIDFIDIHDSRPNPKRLKRSIEWLYLQSISQNILCGESQCKSLTDNGLFLILHYIRKNFPEVEVHDWIAQTLANLSAYKETHKHFWSTQWFSILVEWLQSDRLERSLSAAKILYNLNQESDQHLLPESIYLLHPIFYDTSNKKYDIILVHGLLGGTFKTWRQCDTEKQREDYTRCWPQKWLATDFNNIRILAVNYQTFLSNWNIECQDSNSIFTLKQRSSQVLNGLVKSNIGKKPIIWITHSMGGLIVKQMLVDINESNDPKLKPILDQTKGIIFYSVPHKGSEMAVWSPYLQKIISPSSEVLELRKDSKLLHSLHNQFLQLLENKSIECLSFGETLKSTFIKRPFKWSKLLVPVESANPGVGDFHILAVNHFNICKPKDKSSEAYDKTMSFIKRLIEKTNNEKNDIKTDKIRLLFPTIFS